MPVLLTAGSRAAGDWSRWIGGKAATMAPMPNRRLAALFLVLLACAAPVTATRQAPAEIERAFARLYNFDFKGTHAILDTYVSSHPADPLGYGVRSTTYLYYELHRLGILEAEFFVDDKRLSDGKKAKADPTIRRQLFQAVEDAKSRALALLATDPDDHNALFAMLMTQGVVMDYASLIEKKHLGSLLFAKRSNSYAQRLLKLTPEFYDAYLTTGFTEYLVGSLPFFVRWFVRFEDVKGSKEQGIQNLQLVAQSGQYFKPFAKFLLAMVYLREKKPQETEWLLADLAGEYPENPVVRKELAKVSARIRSGGSATGGRPSHPHHAKAPAQQGFCFTPLDADNKVVSNRR